jgi:PAS domain S-box-containing protein
MDFLVHWASLILVASAVVLSLVLWRRQRDARVLLLTGLLAAMAARFVLFVVRVQYGRDVSTLVGWVQLAAAGLGVAALIALEQLLTSEKKRRTAISKIEGALQEFGVGTAATGYEFLRQAVHRVSKLLEMDYAFVGEVTEEDGVPTIRLLALSERGRDAELCSYPLAGSPCERVVGKKAWSLAAGARRAFPNHEVSARLGIESYIGAPLAGGGGEPIGLVAAMGRTPIHDPSTLLPALRIVATRAQVEILRERHDRQLLESERRYRELFEESQDALYVSHRDGHMLDVNSAAVALFGYPSKSELLESFYALDHYCEPEQRGELMKLFEKQRQVEDYPVDVRRRNGEVVNALLTATAALDAGGAISTIRGRLRDVSKERELQRQIMRSQRMEAVGRMAGGVAHDFNNILTVINGHSDLVLSDLPADSPFAADLKEIKSAVQRASAFTRRLLLLSRRSLLEPRAIDLNEVIRELSLLLQSAVGADVVIELDLEDGAGDVIADATEMEQVLLNLVINARDAMPSGGALRIRTRAGDAVTAARERGLAAGAWIELSVEDEGLGIEPDVMDHIFEPFFSTKDATIGTGLGLSTVYGIVKQLKGDIAVDSTLGVGTRFSILIPAIEHTAAAAVDAVARGEQGGTETLLVVDDEPAVRRLCQEYLKTRGYRVLVAAGGKEALEQLRAETVDLLISDVMMPGMRGDELVVMARRSHQGLRVLLMSGHVTAAADLDGARDVGFLSKPFAPSELARRVREVLDAA